MFMSTKQGTCSVLVNDFDSLIFDAMCYFVPV